MIFHRYPDVLEKIVAYKIPNRLILDVVPVPKWVVFVDFVTALSRSKRRKLQLCAKVASELSTHGRFASKLFGEKIDGAFQCLFWCLEYTVNKS